MNRWGNQGGETGRIGEGTGKGDSSALSRK